MILARDTDGRAGDIVYRCDRLFSVFHTVLFTWDGRDRVWVYSGDVGTFIWELGGEGEWVYRERDGEPWPEYLRRRVPKFLL